ncbi:MAG TPA: Uma2 family endonuclease [Actinomycetes bacterium]|nr:Uma2 family endonuclease [Actinomycetes bacterium]
MTLVSTLPQSRPLTRDDLETMPDDGHRYELLDGILIVSPAPRPRHQEAVASLLVVLRPAAPRDLLVLTAPLDVALTNDTVLQPDVLVARRSDFSERDLPTTPLLAIEVLSPHTRRFDLLLKRDRLQTAGCPSFWVVDVDEPSIIAWQLVDGVYVEVGRAAGSQRIQLSQPFEVAFSPAELVG